MTEDEQIKAENEKKQRELVSAYKRLFMTDDGKKILADLEKFCGFHNTSVNERDPNSHQTFFAEGKRRVYLRINGFLRRKEDD
jgi:hypothetical protein